MSVDTQKAFDLSIYPPNELAFRLPIDAVCVSMDAEDPATRETPFAVPFTFTVDFVAQTVKRLDYSDQDVREICNYSPDIVAICDHFLDPKNYNETNIYLWISGPDDYPDSRLNVGVGKITSPSTGEIKNYGGLNTTLSEDECLDLAYWASGFSLNGTSRPGSLVELRNSPIFIAQSEDGSEWEWVLNQILKDPLLAEFILSGEADKLYEDRIFGVRGMSKQVQVGLAVATTAYEYVYWGAWLEKIMMVRYGVVLNGQSSGCGLLNSDLLQSFNTKLSFSSGNLFKIPRESPIVCSEILCPKCFWRPSETEMSQLESGILTACPDCGFKP